MKPLRAAVAAVLLGCFGCSGADDAQSTTDNLDASEAPLARFAPYMKTLSETIEKPDTVEEAADALLGSGRPAAFSLQALCRLYKDQDDQFSELRDDFKGLEDGIGAYDKWNGIFEEAVSEKKDAATLEKLKKQRDDALVKFTKLLVDRGWRSEDPSTSRIRQINDFLHDFDWADRDKDRKEILGELIDELEDVKETKYDMKILEEGDGVHELRRDIRWVLIEELVLNGMVVFRKDDECPVEAYANLVNEPIASSKYASLKGSSLEPDPCQVSQCIVIAGAKLVDDIGTLKDQAEKEINIAGDADIVPEAIQPKVQAIYDEMLENDLPGVFLGQLQECKDAL